MTRYASFTIRKDIKRKWLKALRSGKYKQATGVLYDSATGGYCCLGVLCKVSGRTEKEIAVRYIPETLDLKEFNAAGWHVPYCGCDYTLPDLNDEKKLSFKQIANIIERTVQTH